MTKQRYLGVAAILALGGCTTMSNAISGKGMGEVVDMRDGTLEITAAGGLSANRTTTYDKWDRTASKACGGRPYATIKREWQSGEYPGLLVGVIRCR
jgi:hypothetical protein